MRRKTSGVSYAPACDLCQAPDLTSGVHMTAIPTGNTTMGRQVTLCDRCASAVAVRHANNVIAKSISKRRRRTRA